MSVTVRHLNADSSFHLIFSPEPHPKQADLRSSNGAYSILIDPWLVGSSITTASWFAITNRVVPSCIQHLSELGDEPDVVLCSQNKPDHTNKATLLQLRPEAKTMIVAEPAAAKAIKSWKHFDPNRVHAMGKYDHRSPFGNSLRLYIPPLAPDGDAGEVNISFIPAKNYITGLHNAFGITYQAPTRSKALAPVSTIDLPKTKYFHLPLSPASLPSNSPSYINAHTLPGTYADEDSFGDLFSNSKSSSDWTPGHRPQLSRSTNTASSELISFSEKPVLQPPMADSYRAIEQPTYPIQSIQFQESSLAEPFSFRLPTPPLSPDVDSLPENSLSSVDFRHKPSVSSLSSNATSVPHRLSMSNKHQTIHPARPKAVSVLYTPHGMPLSDLKPYIRNHLVRLPGALPLTLLLHSFDRTQNPWYFGGNIMTGAIGGMDIAKALMVRCWISAHDELKDDQGIAVKLLKLQRTPAEEIRRDLLVSQENRSSGWVCDVRNLEVGKEITLSGSARDLCTGVRSHLGSETSTAGSFLPPTEEVAG